MSSHYHEHHAALIAWPWKLFCAKWARLIRHAAAERAKDQARQQDDTFAELKARHYQ